MKEKINVEKMEDLNYFLFFFSPLLALHDTCPFAMWQKKIISLSFFFVRGNIKRLETFKRLLLINR